jgi:lysophospholipase L1-like esterase
MKKIFLKIIFYFLLLHSFIVKAQPFAADIAVFQIQDAGSFPAKHSILFVGSSSFTKWKDVQSYFLGYPIINRGFGGSSLPDVIRYANQIIFPYEPKQIVIYCGENDFAASDSVTAEMVVDRFETLFKLIRKKMPDVPVLFVSIKPSPSREKFWPKMEAANDAIKSIMENETNAVFVDVYHLMFNADGTVMKDIFLSDNLHMNAKGYAIWQAAIAPYLLQ